MMLTTNGAVIRYYVTYSYENGAHHNLVSLWHLAHLFRVIDAYEGKPMFTLAGYQNNKVGLNYCTAVKTKQCYAF